MTAHHETRISNTPHLSASTHVPPAPHRHFRKPKDAGQTTVGGTSGHWTSVRPVVQQRALFEVACRGAGGNEREAAWRLRRTPRHRGAVPLLPPSAPSPPPAMKALRQVGESAPGRVNVANPRRGLPVACLPSACAPDGQGRGSCCDQIRRKLRQQSLNQLGERCVDHGVPPWCELVRSHPGWIRRRTRGRALTSSDNSTQRFTSSDAVPCPSDAFGRFWTACGG